MTENIDIAVARPNFGDEPEVSVQEIDIMNGHLKMLVETSHYMNDMELSPTLSMPNGSRVTFSMMNDPEGPLLKKDNADRAFISVTEPTAATPGYDDGARRKLTWSIGINDNQSPQEVSDYFIPLGPDGYPEPVLSRDIEKSPIPTREQYQKLALAIEFYTANRYKSPMEVTAETPLNNPNRAASYQEVENLTKNLDTLVSALKYYEVAYDQKNPLKMTDEDGREVELSVAGDKYTLTVHQPKELDEEARTLRRKVSWSVFKVGEKKVGDFTDDTQILDADGQVVSTSSNLITEEQASDDGYSKLPTLRACRIIEDGIEHIEDKTQSPHID